MVSSRSSGSSGVPTTPSSGSYPKDFCEICCRNIINLRRHVLEVHGEPEVCYCPVTSCDRSINGSGDGFKRRANMKTHLKGQHGDEALVYYEHHEQRTRR
jgi:hypothetical protein